MEVILYKNSAFSLSAMTNTSSPFRIISAILGKLENTEPLFNIGLSRCPKYQALPCSPALAVVVRCPILLSGTLYSRLIAVLDKNIGATVESMPRLGTNILLAGDWLPTGNLVKGPIGVNPDMAVVVATSNG
mgnify:CR=1 FL=1